MSGERELTPELAKQLFAPRDLNEPQPEPQLASDDPVVRMRARDEQREARERAAEAERIREPEPDEAHAALLGELLNPFAKRERDAAIVRRLHGTDDEAA